MAHISNKVQRSLGGGEDEPLCTGRPIDIKFCEELFKKQKAVEENKYQVLQPISDYINRFIIPVQE